MLTIKNYDMNREIKFRAWNHRSKKMYYNVCIDMHGHANDGTLYLTYDREKDSVMQYTGLKDKNGKEVYEGDIIEQDNNKEWREVVGYDIKNAAFGFLTEGKECYNWAHGWGESQGFTMKDMEVIGNIYENPDLLDN